MTKANTISIPVGFNPADSTSVAAAFALLPNDGTDAFAVTQGDVNLIGPTLTADILSVASGPLVLVTDFEYALSLPVESFSLATGGVVEVVEFVGVTPPAAVVAVAGLAPGVSTGASVAEPVAAVAVAVAVPTVAGGANVAVPAAGIAVAGVVPEAVGRPRTQVRVPVAGVDVAGLAPSVAGGASVVVPAAGVTVTALAPTATAGAVAEEELGWWADWLWHSEN